MMKEHNKRFRINMIQIFITALMLISCCMFMPIDLLAKIRLPAIFGDNMVLQQQSNVAIWGTSNSNSAVVVTTSWNDRTYSVRSSDKGNWKIKVATPQAGGPFEINISDGGTFKLSNILIGEVWVCSGQSNMGMPMKGKRNQPVLGSQDAIAFSSNTNIRLFSVKMAISIKPLDDFDGKWEMCEPNNVAEFSATAYYFGRMLNKVLNVPIGLINASWGGTRIEPWMGENGFKNFDWISIPKVIPDDTFPQSPTIIYNAMIKPMVGYGIKGAIWYQGEANRNEPQQYQKLMVSLIENWRSEWGIGEFPFYFVQIAPFDYGSSGVNSAYLREAQLKASTAIPNIGMACIMDIGEKNCIHPSNKEVGSKRLGFLALAQTYGIKGIACQSPVLKNVEIIDETVKLTFDYAPNGLTSFGKELLCFESAGANRRFYPASAFITQVGVTVISPFVPKPVAVRYAFKNFIVGDLFNTEGFPVSSFRTDPWNLEE